MALGYIPRLTQADVRRARTVASRSPRDAYIRQQLWWRRRGIFVLVYPPHILGYHHPYAYL